MKSAALLLLTLASATTLVRASPTDDVILQTMRLAEAPNYSWITTISTEVATFTLEGRTQPDGFTWVRMPMTRAIAQRLRQRGSGDLEAVFLGDTFVLRMAEGWVAMDVVPWARPGPKVDTFALARGRPAGRMGTLGAPVPASARSGNWRSHDDGELRLPGDIHLGLTPPHEELGIIVSSFVELQIGAQVITGTLSELGAALLLVRDGHVEVTPVSTRGSFRLWLKDGRVAQYQLRLDGVLATGRKTSTVSTLTTTTIKQVGTSPIDIPDEARVMLER